MPTAAIMAFVTPPFMPSDGVVGWTMAHTPRTSVRFCSCTCTVQTTDEMCFSVLYQLNTVHGSSVGEQSQPTCTVKPFTKEGWLGSSIVVRVNSTSCSRLKLVFKLCLAAPRSELLKIAACAVVSGTC